MRFEIKCHLCGDGDAGTQSDHYAGPSPPLSQHSPVGRYSTRLCALGKLRRLGLSRRRLPAACWSTCSLNARWKLLLGECSKQMQSTSCLRVCAGAQRKPTSCRRRATRSAAFDGGATQQQQHKQQQRNELERKNK